MCLFLILSLSCFYSISLVFAFSLSSQLVLVTFHSICSVNNRNKNDIEIERTLSGTLLVYVYGIKTNGNWKKKKKRKTISIRVIRTRTRTYTVRCVAEGCVIQLDTYWNLCCYFACSFVCMRYSGLNYIVCELLEFVGFHNFVFKSTQFAPPVVLFIKLLSAISELCAYKAHFFFQRTYFSLIDGL